MGGWSSVMARRMAGCLGLIVVLMMPALCTAEDTYRTNLELVEKAVRVAADSMELAPPAGTDHFLDIDAGTGSEAQSYAIISDAETHNKMACGDEKARFRVSSSIRPWCRPCRKKSQRSPASTRWRMRSKVMFRHPEIRYRICSRGRRGGCFPETLIGPG